MALKRPDDFEVRRQHLKDLTDEELEKGFGSLQKK
ncbi:D-ornithine 4,5-aminomutase subunit OraS [Caloramator sp. mosi_1]